ncbi:hypothetical protein FHS22_003070 [Planomonospora venezuelensis]|uniref:Uncharacterized protein n=1 Tax=Planomonospora venezuelensis TaxID=1999 RepID=A0A841D608_PLAVE|nr:hypothetical protein [Planomonospora venezuelensis]
MMLGGGDDAPRERTGGPHAVLFPALRAFALRDALRTRRDERAGTGVTRPAAPPL